VAATEVSREGLTLEVVGELDGGGNFINGGAEGGFDEDFWSGVSDFDFETITFLLGGKAEGVVALVELAGEWGLLPEVGSGELGALFGAFL